MHGMHARLPKHFVLEERLERYRDAIEPDPYHWRGYWASACAPEPSIKLTITFDPDPEPEPAPAEAPEQPAAVEVADEDYDF